MAKQDFERPLYGLLAAYKNGTPKAANDLFDFLVSQDNRPVPQGALTALTEILKIQNEDIQIAATVALGSMKERAVDAVQALEHLAKSEEGKVANAAVCALGEIPGGQSVQAILNALDMCQDRPVSDKAWSIVQICSRRAAEFCGSLSRIEEALKTIYAPDSSEYKEYPLMCKSALDTIRFHARENTSLALESMYLPEQVDIQDAIRWCRQNGYKEDLLPQRESRLDPGDKLNARFRFRINQPSEIGLQIRRHPQDSERYLVIISNDDKSYGDSLTQNFETIAWAVRGMYSLQNADITWIEHNAPESGVTAENKHEFDHVTFGHDDKATRLLSHPEWAYIENFPKFLKEWARGI